MGICAGGPGRRFRWGWLGWYRRAEMAFNPLVQIFRPISPLAWIPISILWFGVGDLAAIFLIFWLLLFPCC